MYKKTGGLAVLVFGLLGIVSMSGCTTPSWLGIAPANAPTTPPVSSTVPPNSTGTTSIDASWSQPTEIPSLHWFSTVTSSDAFAALGYKYAEFPSTASDIFAEVHYYKVGTTVYHGLPSDVIMVVASENVPGGAEDHYLFVTNSQGTAFIASEASYSADDPRDTYNLIGFTTSTISNDTATTFNSLHFSQTIMGNQPGQELALQEVDDFSVLNGATTTPAFVDTDGEQVYDGTAAFGGAFHVKKGPLVGVYILKPGFVDASSGTVTSIVWSDGTANTTGYTYQSVGGCGASNYIDVISKDQVNPATDLVAAGKIANDGTVYALKDTSSQILKDIYDNTFVPGAPKLSYADFLKQHPLIFWTDPFGRLIALNNTTFEPQAECGKPVIYLYPTRPTTTTVWLQPGAGFTYSDPPYGVDWYMFAEPNGHLTDLRTGKEYHYLFWEGRGAYYQQPKQGWVVKQTDLKTFLPQKLLQLGLNHPEIADFLDFWLPRMQDKPYYFVTFLGNSTMDKLAPLTVDPKPDTVIRILMDFSGLDKPITVKPYPILTPKRTGFTVVEWGGVLR